MATPHSDWPYPTGDPNRSQAECAGEASIAFKRYVDGVDVEEIAEELGLSRATVYRRIKAHGGLHDQPPRVVRQLKAEIRLDRWIIAAQELLDGEASVADKLGALKELRMLDISWRKLFAVDEVPTLEAPAEPPSEPDNWVDGARTEADDELAEVERLLRARINGGGSPP